MLQFSSTGNNIKGSLMKEFLKSYKTWKKKEKGKELLSGGKLICS